MSIAPPFAKSGKRCMVPCPPEHCDCELSLRHQPLPSFGLSGGFHFPTKGAGIDAVIAMFEAADQTDNIVKFLVYLKELKSQGCLNFGVTAVDGATLDQIAGEMLKVAEEMSDPVKKAVALAEGEHDMEVDSLTCQIAWLIGLVATIEAIADDPSINVFVDKFFADSFEKDPKHKGLLSTHRVMAQMAMWKPVASMPKGVWCRTKKEGEAGENVSMWVEGDDMGRREYWDREGYSTIVNPGSFAEPTHWRALPPRGFFGKSK